MRHRRGAMASMVPAHAGLEHGHALSQPCTHHEGSETYGVTVGRAITGRTSGRPIRTPPPAASPLACGITLGRSHAVIVEVELGPALALHQRPVALGWPQHLLSPWH